jgi:signal transduction histidine kinase
VCSSDLLTIVREIISEYGGTVSVVNSELYQGASLEIRIPIGGS